MTHPYWPSDIQVLEKRWSNERAKQRELGEVFDFMGFDDDDDYVGDGDGKERSSFGGVTAIDGGKKKIKLKGKKKRKKRK